MPKVDKVNNLVALAGSVQTVVSGADQLEQAKSAFEFAEMRRIQRREYLVTQNLAGADDSLRDLVANSRFLAIGSRLTPQLLSFVGAAFGDVTMYSVETDKIHGLSGPASPFSIIIVLFDDVTRAKRVFREHKLLMQNKLCYAIMTASKPKDRAELMRFAFDDVFDTRMKPAEMIVRIKAHRSRQIIYDATIDFAEDFRLFCEANIDGRIYPTQMEILRQLYNNMSQVVRYRDLASYDYHAGDFRMQSLKVRVHNLRKRMKNYEIICKRGVGYILQERAS